MDAPEASLAPRPNVLSLRGLCKADRVRIHERLDALRTRQTRVCVHLQLVEERIARAEARIMPVQQCVTNSPIENGSLQKLALRRALLL